LRSSPDAAPDAATDGGAGWVTYRDMTPGESNALGLADMTDDPAHRKRAPDYDRLFGLSNVKTIRIEIDVLNANYPDIESQKAAIEEVFDVESFLPWLAVTAATVHFDSYMTNNHNYYLYHHEDGRFRFITWDHNMAFASPILDYRAKDAAGWDIVEPGDGYRPLIDRILEVPEWREAYLDRVRKLLVGRFSEEEFDRRARELHELLAPWVVGPTGEVPPWTVLTLASHFVRGLTEKLTPVGSLPIPGLLTFAKERRAYLHSVLD
jgi:hypothetical protein